MAEFDKVLGTYWQSGVETVRPGYMCLEVGSPDSECRTSRLVEICLEMDVIDLGAEVDTAATDNYSIMSESCIVDSRTHSITYTSRESSSGCKSAGGSWKSGSNRWPSW